MMTLMMLLLLPSLQVVHNGLQSAFGNFYHLCIASLCLPQEFKLMCSSRVTHLAQLKSKPDSAPTQHCICYMHAKGACTCRPITDTDFDQMQQ